MRRCRSPRLAALALSTGLACASPSPRSARDLLTVELTAVPRAGVVYELLHESRRQRGGEPPRVVRTRLLVEVDAPAEGASPGGVRRGHAVLYRYPRGAEEAGEAEGEDPELRSAVMTFELAEDGRVVGEPVTECGGVGEPRLGRYLRHLFGARALGARAVGVGSTWRAEYRSDATELVSPARLRVDALDGGEVRGRLSARVALEEADVGSYRVSGEGRVRGHRHATTIPRP